MGEMNIQMYMNIIQCGKDFDILLYMLLKGKRINSFSIDEKKNYIHLYRYVVQFQQMNKRKQHRDKFYRIKIKCLKYQMNQEIYFRGICCFSDEMIIMKYISLKSSNVCMCVYEGLSVWPMTTDSHGYFLLCDSTFFFVY